jgi:hypothetical protein
MNHNPEFTAAIERHHAMRQTLGREHPLTQRAFTLVLSLAPPEVTALLVDGAREMGLMPDHADGYLEDGSPVYRLEAVAERLGMSEAQAQESVQAFLADRVALGLDVTPIDPALVHRAH